ncbi:MAG TPA: LLM class flavin-dependent oxidoreductase [Jiangellales bacterium]|nr:LLM class flavin-dependent oxidoreductase [Jiangellales bacterium]
MRFGVYVPTSGEYDAATLIELARDVETHGWDGMFLWDNILTTFDESGHLDDTTVALTAIVLAAERIHCGLIVTPLARRRPWKVAKETATLDRLSGGRLILGVGLGGTWDFAPFGEPPPDRARGELLDEALTVLTACWRGDDVHHHGRYFTVDGARMRPVPVQQPRIPIWIAGYWPGTAPFRRAARWDGIAPLRKGRVFEGLTPEELTACLRYIREHRAENRPLEAVYFHTRANDDARVDEYEDAGATWWLESTNPATETLGEFRARIIAGPPR